MRDDKKYTRQRSFSSIGDVLGGFKVDEDKYISQEFQKYAYDLAKELGDLDHKSLYMRLAKNTPRGMLESARNYVKDAYKVKSKARLFMWELSQLKKEKTKTEEKKG
jgi:hypothetical protein